MPENILSPEAAHAGIKSLGTAGAELGDQAQPETRRAGQPVGRFKMICRQIAALALDILEQME